ncbi:syntaxin-22-like [Telopea speciosissima]|uniref:syntaxin-22-like n=1 Tax=Telopea speciosissima TaxID=54955 RepID=UPI001CC6BBAE|nr:syntaxin-22-like [Telopea speciosissima]
MDVDLKQKLSLNVACNRKGIGSMSEVGIARKGINCLAVPVCQSCKQEVLLLGNEVAFNKAIIEEREKGINDIQQEIGQANEIFRDLAVLVHEQGVVIDDIQSNIEASSVATTQAKMQLSKAHKNAKSRSSWVSVKCNIVSCTGSPYF